jgi:hypothetical protein
MLINLLSKGSPPNAFNHLVLSPNLYNKLPIHQICLFSNLHHLNMSYNSLVNMTDQFRLMSCLRYLVTLDLSHNLISTPVRASDLNDMFGSRLQTLNLSHNRIPSIETAFFFKSDMSPRFPNLTCVNLAYNQIIDFDLMWPLSLSGPVLNVDFSNNPIVSLSNQFNFSFDEISFYDMTETRHVDLRNSSLERLDDTNLLQYGISSASDFQYFLYRIGNYDFWQHNNKLNCSCASYEGQYVLGWFAQFAIEVEAFKNPIYQLKCSNIGNQSVFIFNYTCTVIFEISPRNSDITTQKNIVKQIKNYLRTNL